MKKIKLFLNNIYQAYMAGECGKTWSIEPFTNDIYYKSEVVEKSYFLLPDKFEVRGDYIWDGVKEWELVTENDLSISLVSADGIIKLEKDYI